MTRQEPTDSKSLFREKMRKGVSYAWQEGTTYIIFFVLLIFFECFNVKFLSGQNLYNLLTQSTYFMIAGMGIAFVMLTGGIDLSVGYEMAVVSNTSAILMLNFGFPVWTVFPIGMAIGFLLGCINGLITAKLKLFPLIVTLATSEVFKGIVYFITAGKTFSGMPDAFRALYTVKFLSIPIDVYLAVVIIVLTWLVLNKTKFGRDILAVGGNPECARLSGIKCDLVTVLSYGICGALFALASLDMLAQQNLTSSTTGPGTEFTCLTAAIVGGISMTGGKGNVFGLVIGICIMQIIANGMQLAGWGSYPQYIVKGIILLLAVAFDAFKNRGELMGKFQKFIHRKDKKPETASPLPPKGLPPFDQAEALHNPNAKGGIPPFLAGGNPDPRFSGGKPDFKDIPPLADVSKVKNKYLDVQYGSIKHSQSLDIYLPEKGKGPFKVLCQIHGGGFALGDKRDSHITSLLKALDLGYALVSIEYRLSGEAIFPAAVLDVRSAIRFLKDNAAEYNIDKNNIVVIGGSAGGNLAAMLDMNIPNGKFPGEENMKPTKTTPYVKAAIDWFGPTDFAKMDEEAKANGVSFTDHGAPYSAESGYMGKPLGEVDSKTIESANPMTYISAKMSPIFIQHGTVDKLVPFAQSEILYKAIGDKGFGDKAEFMPLKGADHEDKMFTSDENLDRVWKFLEKVFKA
jgi:ribose transport system permease protein